MAIFLIIGCGIFFLTEAIIGLFKPGVYKAVEPNSRKDQPFLLPTMGSILFIWGTICIGFNIPPNQVEAWVLLFLGIPFIGKGIVMAFFPDKLHDTPDKIKSQPRLWKYKCVTRIIVGGILFIWGTVMIGL